MIKFLRNLFSKKEKDSIEVSIPIRLEKQSPIKQEKLVSDTGRTSGAVSGQVSKGNIQQILDDIDRYYPPTHEDGRIQDEKIDKLITLGVTTIPFINTRIETIIMKGQSPTSFSAAEKLCEAIGRIGGDSAYNILIHFLTFQTRIWEYETIRLGAVRGIGHLGDARAIEPLKKILYYNTTPYVLSAVGEVLEKLEGKQSIDPVIILAKADQLSPINKGDEILKLLDQIDGKLFDKLPDNKKYYVWYTRGRVYQFRGDKANAIACYKKSLTYYDTLTYVPMMN